MTAMTETGAVAFAAKDTKKLRWSQSQLHHCTFGSLNFCTGNELIELIFSRVVIRSFSAGIDNAVY